MSFIEFSREFGEFLGTAHKFAFYIILYTLFYVILCIIIILKAIKYVVVDAAPYRVTLKLCINFSSTFIALQEKDDTLNHNFCRLYAVFAAGETAQTQLQHSS